MSRFRRRTFLIEKQLQLKFVLLVIIALSVQTLAIVTVLFAPYILILALDFPVETKSDAAKMFILLHGKAWPAIAGITFFLGVLSIFFSHRIAGPIFRIRRALQEMNSGDLRSNFTLRKHDEMHDVAAEVNFLAEKLRRFVTTLRGSQRQLSEELEALRQDAAIADPAGTVRQRLDRMTQVNDSVKHALDDYRISSEEGEK